MEMREAREKKGRICAGCGALLQSDDPSAPGYVPELGERKAQVLCRRCFRLRHYGALEPVALSAEAYIQQVQSSVDRATGLAVMVDIVDFEGSLDDALLRLCQMKPFLVLVNKVDLLPKIVPPAEVEEWVYRRFETRGLIPESCIGISSLRLSRTAARRLWTEMAEALGPQVAVVGVTNVGKSSFLKAALQQYGRVEDGPTVSDVAGTTLGELRYRFDEYGLTLMDTPGLIPQGRLSDRLCDHCQRALVPHRPLTSRLLEFSPQQSLLLSRFCQLDVISTAGSSELRPLLGVYVPASVTVHKTTPEKAVHLRLDKESKLFDLPCGECTQFLTAAEWDEQVVELRPGQDLAISGLGWITARRVGVQAVLHLPKGIKVEKRVNLIGRKNWLA